MKKLLLAAAAAASVAALAAPAQALVIGTADTSNGIPFGSTIGGYYFQQVYSAATFGAGLDIAKLSFYTSLDPADTTPRAGTFQIYLTTTSAAVPTFDTNNTQSWYDASWTKVFDAALPSVSNGRLDFYLTDTFNYDPSQGNLLITVRTFDGFSDGRLFLDADKNDGVMNSRFSAYPYEWNQGLVTGFNDGPIPEPATWALMITGFGLAGAALRRRRATAA